MVEKHVVGIGAAYVVRTGGGAAAYLARAIHGVDVGSKRSAGTDHAELDHGLVGYEAEEILVGRDLHVAHSAQHGQIAEDEGGHRLAWNHLVMLVQGAEGVLQHVRKRRERAATRAGLS